MNGLLASSSVLSCVAEEEEVFSRVEHSQSHSLLKYQHQQESKQQLTQLKSEVNHHSAVRVSDSKEDVNHSHHECKCCDLCQCAGCGGCDTCGSSAAIPLSAESLRSPTPTASLSLQNQIYFSIPPSPTEHPPK